MHKLLVITIIILCLGACVPGHNDYSDFKNVSVDGWAYNDTICFVPEIGDSVATGVLSIALRHNNNYIYSNIWLEASFNINDSVIKRDTINIELADIYGRWHGKGIGTSFQLELPINAPHIIEPHQPIIIRHIMRVDTLQGIEQIGIIFQENEYAESPI
ncbi:MAG: gliding motility lipoprotein GldH [Muribaculaceae bacterium]|nr:gliding motility lipoprotein GldH [Muribaculaceae bacterium]